MKTLLQDMYVLDFTTNVAGPVCTATLADYGATVIKVERPGSGDDNRQFPPMLDGQGFIHFWCNRGKKSITLNLGEPESIKILTGLLEKCNVIVESYRPGIMDKFGLGYEVIRKIKPEIIYCSISAYGLKGPYSRQPGYDLIAQAMSGLMDLNGEPDGPPMKSGLALGDYWDGLNAYSAVVSAWYYFKRTGKGQLIDASLLQNLLWNNTSILYANVGQDVTRTGNHHSGYSPYSAFKGDDDQYAVITVTEEDQWAALCMVMGKPQLAKDSRFKDNAARVANRRELDGEITAWLRGFRDIREAVALLENAGIPACKVSEMKDLCADPHVKACEWLVEVPLPEDIQTKRSWVTRNINATFSKTPGKSGSSPKLGRDNYEVLGWLGMDKTQVDALMSKWASAK